ncbi:hypothetical protein EVG20_g11106 [Dentipellis fragilis]|uniref:RRM domain-containing protein n=1 Tax=Dentipellis fragilis TaxID=205917 RepID=A0A4Y9XMA5_9AGAM|nr:hypothetical protein EVG20_g11106 [Dentipellis fragilis]
MDEPVTKRLHVSGLTPAITVDDLSRRLGSFGTVKALDEFGKLDALGQPRKFGYITLETTKGKLAKCMNVLSGSTWKGAKLRLGEAKPDYRERIAREHAATAAAEAEPPRKRARLARGVQGVHASSMDPITPENVSRHPQWHVTPLGRLIRPIRMRPAHPLDPVVVKEKVVKKDRDGKVVKERNRKKEPPTRARVRTIDPVKWGSTHLKGVFLEGGLPVPAAVQEVEVEQVETDTTIESDSEEEGEDVVEEAVVKQKTPPAPAPKIATKPPQPPPASARESAPTQTAAKLAAEKVKSLSLLKSMFGDSEEDWGGSESVDSDVDMDDVAPHDREELMAVDHSPAAADTTVVEQPPSEPEPEEAEEAAADAELEPQSSAETEKHPSTQMTKLKDLFAPREDEAGFSLLGHLDLDFDLELADDFFLASAAPAPIPVAIHPPTSTPSAISNPTTIDASRPLFFPAHGRGKGRDALAALGTWRGTFHRTADEESIRQMWEEQRGELTREWKRRHREAVKSRRRRGGIAGADA